MTNVDFSRWQQATVVDRERVTRTDGAAPLGATSRVSPVQVQSSSLDPPAFKRASGILAREQDLPVDETRPLVSPVPRLPSGAKLWQSGRS